MVRVNPAQVTTIRSTSLILDGSISRAAVVTPSSSATASPTILFRQVSPNICLSLFIRRESGGSGARNGTPYFCLIIPCRVDQVEKKNGKGSF